MLYPHSRRLLFTLLRHTSRSLLVRHSPFESWQSTTIRHLNLNEYTKRKVLMKINTVLDEPIVDTDADMTNGTYLQNELILSERNVKFPFHYRCILEQQLSICSDRWVSTNEWAELYNVIGPSTKPLFASITMLVCVQLKHIERGRSLFAFVQHSHPDILAGTPTAYAAYMNLLALDFFVLPNKQHGKDYSLYEKELCDVYERAVRGKQTMIASSTATGIIKGLCVTRLWHEAFSYLPFVDDNNQWEAMNHLILAALHNDDLSAAIKLLTNLKTSPPSDGAAAIVSSSLSETIRDLFRNLNVNNENAYEFVEHLFRYLSTIEYFLDKSAIDEMSTFFVKYKPNLFDFGTTLVHSSGTCKQLPGLSLMRGDLTEEEFNCLRNYLIESAYTAKEVYNTTTPAEFERFKAFLIRTKFTMIVDGLNILYGIDRFATDPVGTMMKTINFLKNLRVTRTQMLFIARKHIFARVPFEIQRDLHSICEVFLVDNTSRDDWFVLYAALHAKAYVLTSDILRKERGIANKSTPAKNIQINELLQKWLYRYQYLFIRQNNRVYFKPPMAYKLRAQCTQNVWLVPYFVHKPTSLAERPDSWFFVYRIAQNKQTAQLALKRKVVVKQPLAAVEQTI